jgi:hypothetical protein
MAYKALPDPEFLRKALDYDPETGILTWKDRPRDHFKSQSAYVRWNKLHAGTHAFAHIDTNGYKTGTIGSVRYYAHRIVWTLTQGVIPPGEIDHINGDRSDNRLRNLRLVNRQMNTQNRKLRSDCQHGVHGVEFHVSKKWKATININKKRVYLGLYSTFEEAKAARKSAERKYGFHPNHGRSS